jgi:hypothetical protein
VRRTLAISIGVVLVAVIAIGAFTLAGQEPHPQNGQAEFCFAEWCIAPDRLVADEGSTVVHAVIRSDARGITQRPDHPQAWIVDAGGHEIGGPQPALARALGPAASFATDLTFPVTMNGCTTFIVGEGGWPPFLGLGYAPSPFTERVSWRLCPA